MLRKRDALSELIPYNEFSKLNTEEKFTKLYQVLSMVLKVMLDVRLNQVKLSEGKELKTQRKKPENPVIKDSDNIKVDK